MARSEARVAPYGGAREAGVDDAGSGGSMTAVAAEVGRQLTKDLRAQVTELERDLLARARDVPEFADALKAEYDAARAAERTGVGFTEWREGRVTQAAAAWVLATVFVRYCEDNGLIGPAFLAGPGERLQEAEERHEQFFREHPNRNDRDWLLAAIGHLSDAHPTAAGLFDRRHNPLWELTPSYEAATALIAFWRRRDDSGALRYAFDGWDTRFLGDLYQDLSESARKTYALLQTPEFVEEFILDLTLTPAIEEFGLAGLRTIDPACGSGHFLLGLFRRHPRRVAAARAEHRRLGADQPRARLGARLRQEPVRDVDRPVPAAGRGVGGGGGAAAGPGAGFSDQRGGGRLAAARPRGARASRRTCWRRASRTRTRRRTSTSSSAPATCSAAAATTWWWGTRRTSR